MNRDKLVDLYTTILAWGLVLGVLTAGFYLWLVVHYGS